ncbi:hypothetical protein [Kroppenstedtia sanguinis]|uniref:Uncharacterized protein n=1 Tax=Kroppenstedtia sanguinis TaxID=1380684 RepID=A0ABW4C979_9BACL
MNKIRAALYAVSAGAILFALFSGIITFFASGELATGISATMVISLAGVGLFLGLILTGTDRRKSSSNCVKEVSKVSTSGSWWLQGVSSGRRGLLRQQDPFAED